MNVRPNPSNTGPSSDFSFLLFSFSSLVSRGQRSVRGASATVLSVPLNDFPLTCKTATFSSILPVLCLGLAIAITLGFALLTGFAGDRAYQRQSTMADLNEYEDAVFEPDQDDDSQVLDGNSDAGAYTEPDVEYESEEGRGPDYIAPPSAQPMSTRPLFGYHMSSPPAPAFKYGKAAMKAPNIGIRGKTAGQSSKPQPAAVRPHAEEQGDCKLPPVRFSEKANPRQHLMIFDQVSKRAYFYLRRMHASMTDATKVPLLKIAREETL